MPTALTLRRSACTTAPVAQARVHKQRPAHCPKSLMFETRSPRNFNSAPQSVTAFIATVLEPAITVLMYLGAMAWHGEELGRADLTLCFLVLALTFPGINRFRDRLSSAAVGILGSWVTLLAILLGFGYGTRSLDLFQIDVILFWAVATPLVQLAAVRLGFMALRQQALQPGNRRNAVVIGAGALGVKVAHALSSSPSQGVDFLGYFDDRADARVHNDSNGLRLGNLLRGGALHPRPRHQGGVHHPAAGLAAAHHRPAGAPAGHHRVDLLRARRVRHQHHPGPPAGHERRAGGGHLRDAVHRHQPDDQAHQRHRAVHPDPDPDLADHDGGGHRRAHELARAGDLPAEAQRPRW